VNEAPSDKTVAMAVAVEEERLFWPGNELLSQMGEFFSSNLR
jgi:hypothetical protein